MSTRPSDWSPLDLSSDPIPGDPTVVRSYAVSYGKVADAITNAATRLNALADHPDSYESEYVDKFKDRAKDVAKDITKAHERYSGVASAMSGYATPLEQAQTMADNALTRARNASDAASTASTQHAHYTNILKEPDLTEDDRTHYTALLNQAATDHATGTGDLGNAKNDLQTAIAHRDAAAKTAADAINDIEGSGGLKDSWWDKAKNFVAEHAELFNKIASVLAQVAGVLAVLAPFLTFIPIIGEIIDVIVLISVIVTVVNAVVQMAAGTESPLKGIFDIALAVIPFGAGKILGRAGDAAVEEVSGQAATTLRASSAARGIKGVTESKALSTVEENLADVKPTVLQRVISDDPENLAKMQALAKMNLTAKGASPRIADAVASNSYKFGGYTKPLDLSDASGQHDPLESKIFPEKEPPVPSNVAAPLDYRIIQPPGWARIPIDGTSDDVVRELVEDAVATAAPGNRPPLRAFLMRQFTDSVAKADRAGAQDFYLPVEQIDGIAVPMSVIVASGPAPASESATAVSDTLLAFAAEESSEAIEVGGQLAVRSVTEAPAEPAADGEIPVPPTRRISYLSSLPGRSDRLMLITASLLRLDGDGADALVEAMEFLFDAMVRTVRFGDREHTS